MPRLLEHLAREGIAERDGRFLYRFDPPAMARAVPPTAGRCSSASPRRPCSCAVSTRRSCRGEMAADMLARLPRARLVEIPGMYHHLVLDAPVAFAEALDEFLSQPIPSV